MEPKRLIELTARQALDEAAQHILPPQRSLSDLTTEQMVADWGLSETTVRRRMAQLVKQGLYEHISVLDGNRIVQVYRRLNHE